MYKNFSVAESEYELAFLDMTKKQIFPTGRCMNAPILWEPLRRAFPTGRLANLVASSYFHSGMAKFLLSYNYSSFQTITTDILARRTPCVPDAWSILGLTHRTSVLYATWSITMFSTQRWLRLFEAMAAPAVGIANVGINQGEAKRLKRPNTVIHIMVNLYSA